MQDLPPPSRRFRPDEEDGVVEVKRMKNMNYRIKTSNILIIITILSFIGYGLFTNPSESTSKNKNVLTQEEIKQSVKR